MNPAASNHEQYVDSCTSHWRVYFVQVWAWNWKCSLPPHLCPCLLLALLYATNPRGNGQCIYHNITHYITIMCGAFAVGTCRYLIAAECGCAVYLLFQSAAATEFSEWCWCSTKINTRCSPTETGPQWRFDNFVVFSEVKYVALGTVMTMPVTSRYVVFAETLLQALQLSESVCWDSW